MDLIGNRWNSPKSFLNSPFFKTCLPSNFCSPSLPHRRSSKSAQIGYKRSESRSYQCNRPNAFPRCNENASSQPPTRPLPANSRHGLLPSLLKPSLGQSVVRGCPHALRFVVRKEFPCTVSLFFIFMTSNILSNACASHLNTRARSPSPQLIDLETNADRLK